QWRYGGQPGYAGQFEHDGNGQQQCGQLSDHGQWRGRCQLHDQLCRGDAHSHAVGFDHHGG
ncbi:MAG: hypothetical protein ABI586_11850, partial [Candidatus Nanopelagicales bacterium]